MTFDSSVIERFVYYLSGLAASLHQIEIFKMRFFNFSLLVFVVLLSLGRAEEQKTSLTSRDYKKLFSQRFNRINKPIISDDEGKLKNLRVLILRVRIKKWKEFF